MFLAIGTYTYAAMVILAFGLLYLFGPQHWYWHALSVAAAIGMGILRFSVYNPSQFFNLPYDNLMLFLLVWGTCAPFFRRHHMPPLHHH